MVLLINKNDFFDDGDGNPRVIISDNVEDDTIFPHIRDAQKYDFQPIVPAAFYTAILQSPAGTELTAFLNNFIVPVMVFLSYNRYLLWIGKNPTQYGLKKTKDDTSEEVGSKERAELMNDVEGKLSQELSKFYVELEALNYTFDGTKYDFTCNKRKRRSSFRHVGNL